MNFVKCITIILFLFFLPKVSSAYFWTNGAHSFTYDINKINYTPGETIILTVSANVIACSNNTYDVKAQATFNGQTKWLYNGVYSPNSIPTVTESFTAPVTPGSYIGNVIDSTGQVPYNVIAYSCTGDIPNNATLCSGDDQGLTQDTPRTIVASCSSLKKCEYQCNPNYSVNGASCVKNPSTPTCSFSWDKSSITVPNSATISWDSVGADNAYLECSGAKYYPKQAIPAKSSALFNFGLNETGVQTCTMTVSNLSGSNTCQDSLVVSAPASVPLPTCDVYWNKSQTTAPGSATISWSTTGATSVFADCNGVFYFPKSAVATWGSVDIDFAVGQTGKEVCTVYASNGLGGNCSDSDTLTIGCGPSCYWTDWGACK